MARVKTGNSVDLRKRALPKGQLLPILVLIWLLFKIGQIPKLLVNNLWLIVKKGTSLLKPRKQFSKGTLRFKKKSKLSSTKLTFPIFHFKKHRRGRPRELPLRTYLHRKYKRVLKKIFPSPLRVGIALGLVIVSLFIYSLFLVVVARDLPSPEKLTTDVSPLTTEIYDRNGVLLYRLYEGKNRTLVKLSDLPSNLINATVSIEDKNFWGHHGVDLAGVTRALISDSHGNTLQGGSTITQQLIKNTLLNQDRTWQRKFKEVLLSFWTERLFSKQQILEMYFNSVAYGGPAWGIEAASQTYFHKNAHDLNLAEAAYLAGLPASPSNYSPFGPHPELGKERQALVLKRMVEDGYITKGQSEEAQDSQLSFQTPVSTIKAPHFVMYVRGLLTQKYGEKEVSEGGLKVVTSLDLNVQKMAEDVVAEEIEKLASLNVSNGAAMVEDPRTGQILAMVGSKNYWDSQDGNFNVALAPRQPGSSIKPLTYATAFKQGYSPGSILLDTPTVFTNPWGTAYAPVNYDGSFHGAVTIRTALGSSYNIPAVKTLALVGIPNMLRTAHDLGITTLNDIDKYGLSLTLGAGEVKLVDMMTVYSTFSQEGIKHDPNPVLKITDSHGNVLEDNTGEQGVRVLSAGVSYLIDSILSDESAREPAFGPNSLLNISGHSVAVKTGTTDSKRDNWTFGFTPNLVVGVWVGNNNNAPMDPSLTSGITGAAPIWNKIMTNLLADVDDVPFDRPSEVVEGTVDGHRDLVISGIKNKRIAKISLGKRKDASTSAEKDVITYQDPFNSYTSDSSGIIAP